MVAGALLFAGAVEGAMRLLDPAPRTQIIRPVEVERSMVVGTLGGEPVWWSRDPAWQALRDPPCFEGADAEVRRLVLVGDSILDQTGGRDADENVAARLQAQLGDGVCVVNLAHAGYSAAQKAVTLLDLMDRGRVDAVLWEVWGEAPTYRWVGDEIVAVGGYALDDAGTPAVPGVPPAANAWLFGHSRAWQFTVLALGAGRATEDLTRWHRVVLDRLAVAGTPLTFFVFPDLKGPFGEPARTRHAAHPPLRALAAERGVAVVEVGERLREEDHLALRLDPCCHYNVRGHEVLARMFADWWQNEGPGSVPR